MTKSDSQNRKRALRALATRAGCRLRLSDAGRNFVEVFLPGFRKYGAAIEMTNEIDNYLLTGSPDALQIVGRAVREAELMNYYPAWNYVHEDFSNQEADRRERHALRRSLNVRGWIVGK